MIKKQHRVTTGIIAALLISNGVIAWQYNQETDSLHKKLESKTEQYEKLQINYTNKIELLERKETEIKSQTGKINQLKDENESLNETVTKQKEDISKLKEQLEQARDRESSSP
ncbi:hypothetical protein [Metabacillus arenae]|uniref:Uncharacterized protein n=1 Tax=Metabacillus arenae TaxID=2771434 RepID=A0A926RZI3_9BACI|nr:hypothetical protein [Metabacillus arenae]MBD1379084.1 hypothetical protein [Metabacillus arenae]